MLKTTDGKVSFLQRIVWLFIDVPMSSDRLTSVESLFAPTSLVSDISVVDS